MVQNIGYMFSKGLYRSIKNGMIVEKAVQDQNVMESKSRKILEINPFKQESDASAFQAMCMPQYAVNPGGAVTAFELNVLYPGLYSGIGNAHGTGDMPFGEDGRRQPDKDFKLGFAFDYTTGLPYVPGSGVKGALRACFIDQTQDVLQALKEVLGSEKEIEKKVLLAVETAIFGNRSGDPDCQQQGCVIFHDAFPASGDAPVMAEDYITPHPAGRAPNPIRTIKIRPGTRMRFAFEMPERICAGGMEIEREKLKELFSRLLVDWGVGAKTHTGYGNLL